MELVNFINVFGIMRVQNRVLAFNNVGVDYDVKTKMPVNFCEKECSAVLFIEI